MSVKRPLLIILYSLPILFLILFFFYPVLEIFRVSLFPTGQVDTSGLQRIITEPYYREVLAFTAWQALLSTVFTMVVGLPAAYAFARYTFPGKTILRAVLTVPFVLPTIVVATAFGALAGPRGLLNRWAVEGLGFDSPPITLQGTLTLILLAHVFYNLAVVIRLVGGFWANLDERVTEAAATLGANRWRQWSEITLPMLFPALVSAALLIFLFCFSSFGVVLILGGSRFATIEVEIYRQTLSLFNLPLAGTLSLIQIAFTFAITSFYTRLQSRATVPLQLRSQQTNVKPMKSLPSKLLVSIGVGLPVLFVLLPLLALVLRSVTVEGQWGLDYYWLLGVNERNSVFSNPPLTAIQNSFLFAGATTAMSLVLGALTAYLLAPTNQRKGLTWVEPLFLLPLGTSAVTLGLGFIIALDEPPLNLRTSVWLIPIAHTLIAFPFVVRTVLPILRSIPNTLREAAATLGATPFRQRWEIDFPIIGRALLVGAIFAFAASMGEFGATSLVKRPEFPTMPIVIFDYLGRPGVENYGRAIAMSVILMSSTLISFMSIERFRIGDAGEF
jgi:thiamine transport system permease protein